MISDLLEGYRSGRITPTEVIESVVDCADVATERHVWISRLSRECALKHARALERRRIDEMPLYGIPFVIKDNIDLTGMQTTAGCAEFSYAPARSAAVVEKLMAAGAIPLGKTNLDQFATGLVGTRSPYGACRNSFNANFISGGSSSGSAVAVATGLASFALGTDTAGSGRIPAAFNNILGLKPSCGRLSTRGVVPACRSLDCVSIFALTSEDAARVLSVAEGFDPEDPYSRVLGDAPIRGRRCGVPRPEQREFFGDASYARLFDEAIVRIESLGYAVSEIDFGPFFEAARLLYEGPWIAERYAGLRSFLGLHERALHPVTRQIIEAGKSRSAAELFEAQYRLMALRRTEQAVWGGVDVIMTPTAGTIYDLASVEAAPVQLNSNLGYYTNFMNLLDLAAVAVPAGFRADGLPFGVTLAAPRATDRALLEVAGELHRASSLRLGALGLEMPARSVGRSTMIAEGFTAIAVCGAHLEGMPLNRQLRDRGGYLIRCARTSAHYKLFALPGDLPKRAGLVRTRNDGASIEVEVWALSSCELGSFIEQIPSPLGLGRVELEDGQTVCGFLCEAWATSDALDITQFGGWRAYLDGS